MITLGAFRLERCIGRGGSAEVWRALHVSQSVPVAIKVMTGERARNSDYLALLRNEVQAVAGLDHPGIVVVFDHGEVSAAVEDESQGLLPAGSPYLAMELADRGTLADLRGRELDWEELRHILLALLDALAHAHARGVIHRDLKPSNVLLWSGIAPLATLKLADFGLAHALDRQFRSDSTEFVGGTPAYMAPEQLRGLWRDSGPWTDLYSLGCLAWHLASGHPPFPQPSFLAVVRAQLDEEPPPLLPSLPLPSGFEGWLRRLLAKDPAERYRRAADAAWGLLRLGAPLAHEGKSGSLSSAPGMIFPTLSQLEPVLARVGAAGDEGPPPAPAPRPLSAVSECPPLPASWVRPSGLTARLRLLGVGLGLYGLRAIPLVGRRAERSALWEQLALVHQSGGAQLVLLHGAAGNGKTRLANWIAERAHELGAAIVLRAEHGPIPSPGDGLPRMLARHLRVLGLPRADLRARLQALLRADGVNASWEWNAMAELLAPAVGSDWGTSGAEVAGEGDGEAGRVGQVGASRPLARAERDGLIRRFLTRRARERPLILLLDDLHWGADALTFALETLRRQESEPLPALLLATVADEALAERPLESALVAELLSLNRAQALEIGPLPAQDHASLVEQLLGLSGELAAEVERRTAGNPLFATQLVGDWVERGVLVAGESGFVLRAGETATLPDDVYELWSARIERLLTGELESARPALEIAALLGPTVDGREWSEACAAAGVVAPPELSEALIIQRLASRTEEGWSFVHGMLRETLEREAREAGRVTAHHRACAQMLTHRLTARGVAERLGRHLDLAGEREAALAPLLQGARERRETSDYPAAQALLAHRQEILEALAISADDPRWGEGWVLRARVHLHQGQLDDVFRWAEPAAAMAEDPHWRTIHSEALRLLGDAARRRGDLAQAEELYRRCTALLDRLNNPHGVAASFWGLADILRQRGDWEGAKELLARSRQLYEEIGDAHGLADFLIGLGDLGRQRLRLTSAEEYYGQALGLFERLGNQYGVARSWNGLGEVARLRGQAGAAAVSYRRAHKILDGLRSADEVVPRLNLALLDLAGGRLDAAGDQLEAARLRLELLGWQSLLACTLINLLPCTAQARRWTVWDEQLEEGAAALAAGGLFDPDLAWSAELAGELADAAGETARAQAALQLALAQRRGLGHREEAGRLAAALARLE